MSRVLCFVVAVLLCAPPGALAESAPQAPPADSGLVFAVPDAAELLTPERIAALEAGEVVALRAEMGQGGGTSRGGGTVMVLANRPVGQVWAHLLDYADYAKYLPRVKKVEKYLEEENRLGLKLTARIIVRTIVQHVINTVDAEQRMITWALDHSKENDIRDTRGAWILVPHGKEQTVIVYAIAIDMGWRLPKWLENFLIRRDLPDFPVALKKHAESEPS
jgi:hypothetical protein